MSSSLDSLKIKAKLLQKAKKKAGVEFPLKEAYHTIAKSAGYASWKAMKDDIEVADLLNPPRWSAVWKIWFNSKEEALKHMTSITNYLIPYRSQFFICDSNYITELGILPDDQDLQKVGHDWSEPKDKEAWKRLILKMRNRKAS